MVEGEALFAVFMLVNTTKLLLHSVLIIIPAVNKLGSFCAFAYLVSNQILALVRSRSTLTRIYWLLCAFVKSTNYLSYRIKSVLDTPGQAVLISVIFVEQEEIRRSAILIG